MNETLSPLLYLGVFVALAVLTVLTVGLSFFDLPGAWHVVCGVSIAIVKGLLVALFFMHLVRSDGAIRAVALTAIFWLTIVLMLLTFSDYATRGWFPGTPGH